jgi:hypothetical protein
MSKLKEIIMINKKKLIILIVLLGCLSSFVGCTSLGPIYKKVDTIPEGKGLVYLYRPGAFFGGGISYDVKVGDNVITTLYPGGYYPYFSNPGEIEFWGKTEARTAVTLDVKPGQIYYVKGTVGIGILVGRPHLIVVPPEEAEQEITDCKLIPEPEKN